MAGMPLALHLPQSALPPPSAVPPPLTPVQQLTAQALSSDYDLVCVPLTNDLWRERWERLCLRPIDDEEDGVTDGTRAWMERERMARQTEIEAEKWRKEGGFRRSELNVTRLGALTRREVLERMMLTLGRPEMQRRLDA